MFAPVETATDIPHLLVLRHSKAIAFQLEANGLQPAIDTAGSPQALCIHVKALQDLRARSLTWQERAALFPDDDAYEELLQARLELRYEASLDDQGKQRRLAELEGSVSPELRAVERAIRHRGAGGRRERWTLKHADRARAVRSGPLRTLKVIAP